MISAPPCPAPHLFRWKRSFSPSPEPNTQPCPRPVALRPHTRMLRPARAASTLVRPYGLFRCDCLCSGHGRPPFSSLHIGKGPSRRISHRRTNRSREYSVALRVICSAAAHEGPVSLRCACQPRSWSPCCHLGDAPDSEADARGSARPPGTRSRVRTEPPPSGRLVPGRHASSFLKPSGAGLLFPAAERDATAPAPPPLLRSHDSPCTFLEGEGTTRAPEACRGEGAGAGTAGSPPSPQRSTADRGSPGTRHRTGVLAPRLRAARPRGCAG